MFIGIDSFDILIGPESPESASAAKKASLKADIWRLASEGYTSIEIYGRLKHVAAQTEDGLHALRRYIIKRVCEFKKAGGLVSRAKRELQYSEAGPLMLPIDRDRRSIIDLEAADRGMSTADLMMRVIEELVDNDRFGAILGKSSPWL